MLFALAVFVYSCNNPSATENATASKDTTAADSEDVKAFIQKEGSAFQEEVKRADSNAIAAHYSSDALIMPPNGESVKGNDIAGFWGGAIRMFGIKDLKLNITDVTADNNVAVESGTYEMLGEGNKSLDKGKYLVVWKKENGSWKMYRDMFSSNLPAPGAK